MARFDHVFAVRRSRSSSSQWLRGAIDEGLDLGTMLETEPALAPLRTRADFVELAQRSLTA